MACLLYCVIIKQAFEYEQKVFTFKHSLNIGVCLSPSEMNMRNSLLHALLTHMH